MKRDVRIASSSFSNAFWPARLALACLTALVVAGVASADRPEHLKLRYLTGHDLADKAAGFTEPSGLSLFSDGGFLSVSDNSARVFRLDPQGRLRGTVQPSVFEGLEGITEDRGRNRLLAVKEDSSEIIVIEGEEVRRISLLGIGNAERLSGHFKKNDNDGLEGIAVEPETGTVFALKERAPRLLIELSPDLAEIRRVVPLTADIGFVARDAEDDRLDVSGLAWDAKRKGLWIISDTGSAIFFFNTTEMRATGWRLLEWRDGKSVPVENAEGVALSTDAERLYVVTDSKEKSRFLSYGIDRL